MKKLISQCRQVFSKRSHSNKDSAASAKDVMKRVDDQIGRAVTRLSER